MVHGVQVIEKNHLNAPQNRVIGSGMSEKEKRNYWILQVLIASAIAVAALGPVAVLAA